VITARASIVKAPPGRYRIAAVLEPLISHYHKRGHPRYSREELVRKSRERDRVRYRRKKSALLHGPENICNLPDDERELWNRPDTA
jgi:hypothetical protein